MLSKILSLTIEHNILGNQCASLIVVNCFQKSYLWLLNTTYMKISYLRYGCELLSKILSLTIEHNFEGFEDSWDTVVNCFQKSYLWLLNTTWVIWKRKQWLLWIAFKNLIFDYWTQRACGGFSLSRRCELLSKILSLTIEHNWLWRYSFQSSVVNCFQKSYLWLLNTTV